MVRNNKVHAFMRLCVSSTYKQSDTSSVRCKESSATEEDDS
jgi:hypothetical protein